MTSARRKLQCVTLLAYSITAVFRTGHFSACSLLHVKLLAAEISSGQAHITLPVKPFCKLLSSMANWLILHSHLSYCLLAWLSE